MCAGDVCREDDHVVVLTSRSVYSWPHHDSAALISLSPGLRRDTVSHTRLDFLRHNVNDNKTD